MAASLGQPEAFVDADAVAAFLSVERRQVLEMARRGLIPSHPLKAQGMGARKTWRFRLTEVADAVAGGSGKPAQSTIRLGSPVSQRRNSNG
jgi:hypothetical protein